MSISQNSLGGTETKEKYSLATLRTQLIKENVQLQKELTAIKKKYPLAYLAYLVNKATIAEFVSVAVEQAQIDTDVATKLSVHFRMCRSNFERDAGRATNDEEAINAIETFGNCIFGGI
jgi:phage tail sheath protein FI